jgi:hypothetical protein
MDQIDPEFKTKNSKSFWEFKSEKIDDFLNLYDIWEDDNVVKLKALFFMKKYFQNGPMPQIYVVEGILNDCDMSLKQMK